MLGLYLSALFRSFPLFPKVYIDIVLLNFMIEAFHFIRKTYIFIENFVDSNKKQINEKFCIMS